MNEDNSRRQFLRWLGASSGALLLGGVACRSSSSGSNGGEDFDAGIENDGGPGDVEMGGESCQVTGSDIRGPFHEDGAPDRTKIAGDDEEGERLLIEGTVYGPDCTTPLAGVLLDVWQADVNGDYHGAEDDDYRLRGQLMTGDDGSYRFETIRPGNYPMGPDLIRPAHIHFTITKPGYTPLTTQLYFAGDPHLAPDDPCGQCNSGDPTLIIDLESSQEEGIDHQGVFDVVLAQG